MTLQSGNWEATLEPVHLSPDGQFCDVVIGPKGIRVTKSKVLLGYILAQYIDGVMRSLLAQTALISILRTQLKY